MFGAGLHVGLPFGKVFTNSVLSVNLERSTIGNHLSVIISRQSHAVPGFCWGKPRTS